MAVIVAALLTRMVVPTGYMPMIENGHIVIALCAEQNPGLSAMPDMADMPHMHGMSHATGHSGAPAMPDHDKNGACGFGGLSLASLAAIDPILLALSILLIVASVFRRPQTALVTAPRFLWPPRTGPPVRA